MFSGKGEWIRHFKEGRNIGELSKYEAHIIKKKTNVEDLAWILKGAV